MLLRREEVVQPKLPNGSYLYKHKNGQDIYKNKFVDEYYIVFSTGRGTYIIEQYKGECRC